MSRRALGTAALLGAICALLGASPAAAGPIGMVCTNGPTFNLETGSGSAETPDGNSIFMWGFVPSGGGFQTPGPVLCVTAGQTVTINLHNTLPAPTSLVFPGQTGVSASGDAQGLFTAEAASGNGHATYTFTASRPGTYLYESGTDPGAQVEMGLYGVLVVRPAGHPDWAYDSAATRFDPSREYLLLVNELDPVQHSAVETGGTFDVTAVHNRYFTVNGREFPDTILDNGVSWLPHQPYGALVRAQPYSATQNNLPALIRLANAGELNHPFHPHGNHMRMIARDGRRLLTPGGADASTEHFAETVASGSTEDFLFTWNDQDSFSPQNPVGVTLPNYRNLAFKDNNTWYSGSPYLGFKGTLPTGVQSQNVCGEFYFPWHSHALNEFTNFDEGFGGMATLLRVDPLGGCFAFPGSTTILAGTLRAGSSTALGADDAVYYEVNSAATPTPPTGQHTDWRGNFTGLPAGLSNLTVTYKGKTSVAATQSLFLWNWTTSTWTALGAAQAVGTTDVTMTRALAGSPAPYLSGGQLRVRVLTQRTTGTAQYFSSGNLLKVTYDAP